MVAVLPNRASMRMNRMLGSRRPVSMDGRRLHFPEAIFAFKNVAGFTARVRGMTG